MGRKILIGITILLISGLFAGWYIFTREAKYFGTSAFSALPENASVIIRIHNLKKYTTRSLNNQVWKAYSGFPGIKSLYRKLSFADSLLNLVPYTNNSFVNNDLTVVFGENNNNSWTLSLMELSSLAEKRALSNLTEKFFSKKNVTLIKTKTEGADIHCYTWDQAGGHNLYYISFFRGIFLVCTDLQVLVQAVNNIRTPFNQKNSVFEKANKTATENIDLNIYLNHKNLSQVTRHLFTGSFLDRLKRSAPLAQWSEIDMTQKKDELYFNGFSFSGDQSNNYTGIFLHQKPDSINLTRVFPSESSFFVSYMISNNEKFFGDYESLLNKNNGLSEYRNSIKEINYLYNVDIQKIVIDNLKGSAAMVFTRYDPLLPDENKYLVLRVGSATKMENAMIQMTIPAIKNRKRDKTINFRLYNTDKENIFKIYKSPVNDFGKRVFGDIFSDVVTNYFTFYDNFLIMGASYESLGRFLRANVTKETLGNDPTFQEFASGLSTRFNLFIWSSPGPALQYFKGILNVDVFQSTENKLEELQKIESAGWQAGIENGMTYNMARLKYNPDMRQTQATTVWKSYLGNSVITRPKFVTNPSDKSQKEIVLQDGDYNFILIGQEGRILWKIRLKGPIRSEIFQLDCLKDGNLQYFFSTDEALHMISHEGKYVNHFPVALRSTATNGVSVVDYEQNRDYRFFIACGDHSVYLYDQKGKIVNGWTSPKTGFDVVQPVQFFRMDKKDFIVFADKKRTYILDRKGKPRITIKRDISFSHNNITFEPGSGKNHAHLVTTDSKGTIVSIGFDGSVKKSSKGVFSTDHSFIFDDFDSDNRQDYIFSDGDSLVVYDQKSNQIFARRFNHPFGSPPGLYVFPGNIRKIGIADRIENKIYLFSSDGSICKGFPLSGNSPFAISFSGEENGQFNLVTGIQDGYLINYQIK